MRGISAAGLASAIVILCVWNGSTLAAETQPPSDTPWRAQLVVGADDAQRRNTLLAIANRPFSDNNIIVPWLEQNQAHLPFSFQLELSRRLFPDDKAQALQWYVVALARVVYDGGRCADPTAGGSALDVLAFSPAGRTVDEYIQSHGNEFLAAIHAAQGRQDLFGDGGLPTQVCGHGMAAFGEALGVPKDQIQQGLKPVSEWPAIQKAARNFLGTLEKQTLEKIAHPPVVIAGSDVPDEVLAGPIEVKVKAIGDEARTATKLMANWPRGYRLQKLAEAQLDAGDTAGARETLALADSIFASAISDSDRITHLNSIPLWIRAGNPSSAQALVDVLPVGLQRVDALSRYGSGMAQVNNAAEVKRVLDLIDEMYTDPEVAAAALRIVAQHGNDPRALAKYHIAEAFAGARRFEDALDLAERLPAGYFRASLLGDIAAKQCKAKDPTAHTTLQRAKVEAGEALRQNPARWMDAADAACSDGATIASAKFPPAQELIQADASKLTATMPLLELAQRQIAAKETSEAKVSLAKAYRVTQLAIEAGKRDATALLQIQTAVNDLRLIISAYNAIGSYEEAIEASEPLVHFGRPFFLWSVVAAEVQSHDGEAIRRTLPQLISKMSSETFEIEWNLAGLAKTLARGGYVEEARGPLRLAQDMTNQEVNGYRLVQMVEPIAVAQAAMGDAAGARATLKSGTPPGQGIRWELIVTELVNRGDLLEGIELCGELETRRCAGFLQSIASRQADAGKLSAAMSTAWQITDPVARADAMVYLLKKARPS